MRLISKPTYQFHTGHYAEASLIFSLFFSYRLNIFGFPDAAALDNQDLNPGLLDQRKAIEWIHGNIHAFGGDAARMILFGQSAGAFSVDKYAYAYMTDPLVTGFILQSGVADAQPGAGDAVGSNFTYVAQQVGCTQMEKDAQFACMQKANATEIIQVLDTYNATLNGGKALNFNPSSDSETGFGNYTDRQARGLFAKLPTLLGNVNNEFASLVAFDPAGPNQTLVNEETNALFICPGATAAA